MNLDTNRPPLCGKTPVRAPRCKLRQVMTKLDAPADALITYGPEPEWALGQLGSLKKSPDDC